MNQIILSIKPEYANKILDDSKKYEFRKLKPLRNIDKIIIYASSPTKAIIGEVEVTDIINMNPEALWQHTKHSAGISYDKYKIYFRSSKNAYAYCLGKSLLYKKPKTLSSFNINFIPQSFIYIKKN
ncbi:MAG: ASCH domain-containing protein [Mycoplasmoidaceae bacterium]